MALLDWEQPYQYGNLTNAQQGGWSVSEVVTTGAPRPKTAFFRGNAFKTLGSDGSILPGDAGAIIGGRYKWYAGTNVGFMALINSDYQCGVGINGDGTISFRRGNPVTGTTLSTSTYALTTGRLHYIEMDVLLHQTAGWYKVYVDNVLRLNSEDAYPSGVDTCAQASTTWNRFAALMNYYFQNDSHLVTDIYVCDHVDGTTLTPAQPQAFNTPLGDLKASYLEGLAGNTDYTDWAPSTGTDRGEMIDDCADGTPMNTTDYVSAQISGSRVSFALDDLDSTNAVIIGVMPVNSMTKDNSGSKQIKPGHIIAGEPSNPYMGTAVEAPAQGSYRELRELMLVNPATGVAWTPTEVNALKAVVEIV